MPKLPCELTPVDPAELAAVLRELVAPISTDPRLVGALLAQSALETGHWAMVRCWNFGNAKASDRWVAGGGGYTFFTETPPHASAPVSENLTWSQAQANLNLAQQRPDEGGLDMVIASQTAGGLYECLFWPRHVQTRFRAFETLRDGAENWVALLAGRYRSALERGAVGDVTGYCSELFRLHYFTAHPEAYTKHVASLYRKYLPVAQAVAGEERAMPENENPYWTRPEHIAIHPSGWWPLSKVEVTSLPVADIGGRGPLFARGSETVRLWAEERGWRLASDDTYRELHRICGEDGPGIHVDPYPLPDRELYAQGYRPGDPAMASQAWCTRHDEEMMRRLEAAGHDGQPADNVGKHIDQEGDIIGGERHDGDPESKWIQGESPAHRIPAALRGKVKGQLDYMTLVHLERDIPSRPTKRATPGAMRRDELIPPAPTVPSIEPPPDSGPDTLLTVPPMSHPGDRGPRVEAWQRYLVDFFARRGEKALPVYGVDGDHSARPTSETTSWTKRWALLTAADNVRWMWLPDDARPADWTLTDRCLAWVGYQSELDVSEIPGPESDPRILEYSGHCRRGGTFLGVDELGAPTWDGGFSVALPNDEDHWCAAGQSGCLVGNLLPGEMPPHGLRVSVRELCEDARAAGTLHVLGAGYEPKPGDLAIEGRAGQNPLHGGLGHVRRAVEFDPPQYRGWGGNEAMAGVAGDTWGHGWYPLDGRKRPSGHHLVAWVSYQ